VAPVITIAAIVAVVAVTVTVVVLLRGEGGAQAGGQSIPDYQAPANGGGYDTAEWDQPLPLAVGDCSWQQDAAPALSALGGGVVEYRITQSGCQFVLSDRNTILQVHVLGAYNRIDEATGVLRPAQFAGVPGRLYSYSRGTTSDMCSSTLATRSIAVPSIDAYTTNHSGDQNQHCDLAARAAEILARRYVPLAGGTPAAGTAQRQPTGALNGKPACDLARAASAFLHVKAEAGRSGMVALGSTCDYDDPSTLVSALLTQGTPRLAGVPLVPGARVTNTRLGFYPLRMEQEPAKCTLSLEFDDGHVFQLATGPKDGTPTSITCLAGRVALAEVADSLFR
jgi:hypothetical protein